MPRWFKPGHGLIILAVVGLTLLGEFIIDGSLQEENSASDPIPLFEIFSDDNIPRQKLIENPHRPPIKKGDRWGCIRSKLPHVAIIIDDIGYDRKAAEKLMQIKAPLTLSILPYSPHGEEIAKKAQGKGIEIMLHQPMEPVEYPSVSPGKGAMFSWMLTDQIADRINQNLALFPGVAGVNNHMGSKLTTLPGHIYQMMIILKQRNLFFIDSVTTGDSCCHATARLLHLPFAQRDIFLDHFQEIDHIQKQVHMLIRLAEDQGEAVGIGHPYPETCEVLRRIIPSLLNQVEFVPASEIVHTTG